MNILITGIGGMVGQGVLRNIRQSYYNRFRLIGTDVSKFTAGHHLCDQTYQVCPSYQDYLYINRIQQICIEEGINLIIPTTDLEMYTLTRHRHTELADYPILSSPLEVTLMGLDKYKNYQLFKARGLPFADSRLPSEYGNEFEEYIVKPRRGCGSRDIHINPKDAKGFDDSYVVQEMLKGEELTVSFYVKKDGFSHGFITFCRELKNGYTSVAEVISDYDEKINHLIQSMCFCFPFRGSINIQAKVCEGNIVPFELNCRLSGTNSIRSRFGFNDVKYGIQEYLLDEELLPVRITKGSAMRVVKDLIYPEKGLKELNHNSDYYEF